jgi:5-methylthioadenosine/S-adenosylhomocysteine deaminase
VTAPPIPDGAVLVDDEGLIAAVGPDHAVPTPANAEPLEFPDGALVPGLVNCHTHLELTGFAGQVESADFPEWIRQLRALKDRTAPEDFRRAAEQGVRDCWAAGVTCVADTGSTGAAMEALHALGGRGIVYQEVFGPDPVQRDASMAGLIAAVDRLGPLSSAQLRLGVSPHAPYTVSDALYRAVAGFARRERLPIAVHIAESLEEPELIQDGSGPFAEALRARGIKVEAQHHSPVEHLARLNVLASYACLCIHCVQADHQDIERLRLEGASIAHCPRSNRAHAHGVAPLADMRSAGIRVGLGTDSVVSTGDVNLWEDAIAAGLDRSEEGGGKREEGRGKREALLDEDALRMLTLEGARVLGLESQIGSLEAGKQADLAVFPLTVLDRHRPSLTVIAGRVVHG